MRKTRLILGAFVAATALACTGCGQDEDSTANVNLKVMTSEAETTPEEEPEVIVKTSIVTEIVAKPATKTETVADATPAATAAPATPAAPAANPTTGDIYTEKGEKKSGYILTEKVLETIRKNPSFLNVSGEYLVNQDFIIGVVGLIIHLYQNKRILCKEKEIDTLKAFLWNMGQKEIL